MKTLHGFIMREAAVCGRMKPRDMTQTNQFAGAGKMTTKATKCPTCGGDVAARHGEEGTCWYEPCGSDADSYRLAQVRKILREYGEATHGVGYEIAVVEQLKAFREIQRIL